MKAASTSRPTPRSATGSTASAGSRTTSRRWRRTAPRRRRRLAQQAPRGIELSRRHHRLGAAHAHDDDRRAFGEVGAFGEPDRIAEADLALAIGESLGDDAPRADHLAMALVHRG